MEKKVIIWEENNEPPKNYIWVKPDGKAYEYDYISGSWKDSEVIKEIAAKSKDDEEPAEDPSEDQSQEYIEPNLVGWMSKEDMVHYLDIDGDGTITISDWSTAIENYKPNIANECPNGNASTVDALLSSEYSAGEYGYEMATGSQVPVFIRLASEGGERWAIVDFTSYLYDGWLEKDYYAIYDGKPNFAIIGAWNTAK